MFETSEHRAHSVSYWVGRDYRLNARRSEGFVELICS
jgi:hypothetical protein